MPALNESNVRHLLRRTEFVDRPHRVSELLALSSIEEAVDDVLDVPASPPSVTFRSGDRNWQRGEHLTHFWFDRMAHDSPRPVQEKVAFFWHGHFCSEFGKVGSAELMREQIDLFRTDGMGNVRQLAKDTSTQVAMLRYLDNNQNRSTSPNQNFARELMELFLLEVGNYTEADVEAATSAWTGHTDNWETDAYVWRADWHDPAPKQFLGRTINTGADWTLHGYDTIDVILGDGVVPAGATTTSNRGRPTREVAAEFLSRKLWYEFADTAPPPPAMAAMRDALVGADFDVRPWLRTMLTRDEFYAAQVKSGLVRQPVELVVALLVATGFRSETVSPLWLMEGMGQRPLFPPNVSGWKPNGYWVNASAMERRASTAQSFRWRASRTYWDDGGVLQLAGGTISREEITARANGQPVLGNADFVDRLLDLMHLRLEPPARQAIVDFAAASSVWERDEALLLIMLAPDLHLA